MMDKPIISIIICTKNSESTVGETILSLQNQTYKDFEIVVVDKSSDDNTISIILSMFPNAKIRQQMSSGIYAAFNEGIACAAGELIFILNSDDYISPNAIKDIVERFNIENFDACFLPTFSNGGYRNKNKLGLLYKGCDYCFIGHSASFVVKKSVHEVIGYYDENIKNCADYEFFIRLWENKLKVVEIDTLSFGIFRPGGFSGNGNYLEKRIEEFQYRKIKTAFKLSNYIYCYCIFPMQFIWSFVRKLKVTSR